MSNKAKTCTLSINGMHCASCELLIEKELLEKKGVVSADASLSRGEVTFSYKGSKPSIASLNKAFKDLGYTFSKEQRVENTTDSSMIKTVVIAVSFVVAFFILERAGVGRYMSVDTNSSFVAFLLLGFIAGISSCAALVGGLLLSLTKQWNSLYRFEDSFADKSEPHMLFHGGRLMSFFIGGALLGLVGEQISITDQTVFSLITIAVSFVMFALALQMIGVKAANKIVFSTPKFVTRFISDETQFTGRYMPFIVGALTFLMPCGFTLAAQTIALTSASPVRGGLIMLFFALGTMPVLLALSAGSLFFSSTKQKSEIFTRSAGFVVLFFALYSINGQLNVLGLPSISDIGASSTQVATTVKSDVTSQTVSLTAVGFEYQINGSNTYKAGISTTLEVNNKGVLGCGAFIASRGLLSGYVQLQPGVNTIQLGKPRKGSYKITCSMGMVPPVTITFI